MATEKKEIDLSRYLDKDSIRINTDRVDRAMSLFPGQLKEELLDAFDHIRRGFFKALYANTGLKDRRFIATKNVGIGKYLKVYRNPNKGDILDMELGIFSRSKIVALHEKGGIVTAKAGAMAIPLPAALGSTGRLKKEYSSFIAGRRTYVPGQLKGMFILKKGNTALLMMRQPKTSSGEEAIPLFVLRRTMTISPRLRFYDTWDRMEGYRRDILNKSVEKVIDKA